MDEATKFLLEKILHELQGIREELQRPAEPKPVEYPPFGIPQVDWPSHSEQYEVTENVSSNA